MKQTNIENITVALTAGDSKEFAMTGSYFELLSCPNGVDVVLLDRYGAQIARMVGATNTYFVQNVEYSTIQITSSTTQTVKFAYGSGTAGTRSTSGSFDIQNRSGSISRLSATVLSAAVTQLSAANASRKYMLIQNNDSAVALRFRADGVDPTIAQGLRIPPGGYWESSPMFCPTGAIKLIAEAGTVAVEAMEG